MAPAREFFLLLLLVLPGCTQRHAVRPADPAPEIQVSARVSPSLASLSIELHEPAYIAVIGARAGRFDLLFPRDSHSTPRVAHDTLLNLAGFYSAPVLPLRNRGALPRIYVTGNPGGWLADPGRRETLVSESRVLWEPSTAPPAPAQGGTRLIVLAFSTPAERAHLGAQLEALPRFDHHLGDLAAYLRLELDARAAQQVTSVVLLR